MNRSYLLLILLAVLAIGSCKKDEPDPPAAPTPPYYPNGIGEIGTIGGTVAMDDENSPFFGAKIIVPEGALDTPVEIEIKLAEEPIYFEGDSTRKVYRFLPEGLEFNQPVELQLPFEGDTSNMSMYRLIPEEGLIEQLTDVEIDHENSLVKAKTAHFSYYTAYDSNVRMRFDMFKTDGNRICALVDVNGRSGNNTGWVYIPTNFFGLLSGVLNAYNGLELASTSSQFRVYLYEDRFLFDELVSSKVISIRKPTINSVAQFYDIIDNSLVPFYTSPELELADYSNDDNNIVRWFNGEPLAFVFDDFTPDPEENYYVKASWKLSGPLTSYTSEYEFNSSDEKKPISEMNYFPQENFDSNENQIRDEFEDLDDGSGGNDNEPIANFSYSPQNPSIGQTISFTNTSQNFENHLWEFGDGESSEALNPTHAYDTPGTYQVELGVVNDFGTDTHTETITVNSGGNAPVAEFEALNPNADVGVDVFFEDQSQNAVSWVWNFGDGTTNDNNDQEPEHIYNAPGTYTVSLTITNQFGEEDTEVKENYITINSSGGNIPVADFEVDGGQTTITLGEFISFNDLSTNDPTEWEWCFDADCNGTSSQQNPTYMYTQPGVYTVSLIASNSDGPSVPEVKTNYITVESDQTYDCPELELNIGDSCDDGDPETTDDTVNENCECEGIFGSDPVDCLEGGTEVVDVTNFETGKTWMDRNLGASQVATSYNDEAAFGDLYQWGRFSDGHQCRDSETTIFSSSTNLPGHDAYILDSNSPFDWRVPQNDDLWQGSLGTNNPCPEGFRIPTEAEWEEEILSWDDMNDDAAFASPLKLTGAGFRNSFTGGISEAGGSAGYYWTSTVYNDRAIAVNLSSSNANTLDQLRAYGFSLRCIEE